MRRISAGAVPKTALLLSLLALAVPVAGTALFPDRMTGEAGALIWVLVLVPGFLLSYHRGWRGASFALAGGMAALSTGQAVFLATGYSPPPPEALLGFVVVLVTVSLGSGWLATAFRRTLDRTERLALTDYGTGLPNRRHATLELEKAFAAARRGAKLSVVLFDLDHFSRVNDDHGHAVGDRVLAEFADILQAQCRAMNVVARFGGEEFIAIVRETGADGARVFADRVRTTLKETPLPAGPITVSGGVAEYEEGMISPEVLLAAADQALYRAKNQGRDRIVVLGKKGKGRRIPPDAPEADDDGEMPEGRGELVLVVDDDIDALRSVTRALRRFGYTVLEATSPVQAIEVVRGLDDPVDLVLTDMVMPEMGGFRFVEIVEGIQDRIRVLYMSGYEQEDVDWGGVPGEVHDFLSKPISIHMLARRVRRLLAASAAPGGGDEAATEEASAEGPDTSDAPTADRAGLRPEVGVNARILVLHSEPERGELVAELLRTNGYESAEALAGAETVLDRLPHIRPKLVILDLALGESQVADFLGLLRKHPRTAPAVLLLTGERNLHLRTAALEVTAVDFLRKPFDKIELEMRVRNLLRARSDERWGGSRQEEVRSLVAARTAELEEAREEVLQRLAWAAEFRDDVTGRHAERVGVLSGLLARELGWSRSRVDVIRKAAPLHDLGKIGIPDAILKKAGKLTPSERDVMESHTRIGARVLSGSRNPVLREARVIALTHHEWWDGTGYPDGLAKDEIPESGRIVAVTDVFDSLTNDRPYRDGVTWDESVEAITEARGTQFEPRVVDAFLRVMEGDDLKQALDLELVALPDLDGRGS